MANYGMVKTYEVKDVTGKVIDTIRFVFNPLTYVIYMNYTGKDLNADFTSLALSKKNSKALNSMSEELKEKVLNGGFKDVDVKSLSECDIEALSEFASNSQNTEFLINYMASLMATACYPEKPSFEEIICRMPMELIYDNEFAEELFSLLAFGLKDTVKKNINQVLRK